MPLSLVVYQPDGMGRPGPVPADVFAHVVWDPPYGVARTQTTFSGPVVAVDGDRYAPLLDVCLPGTIMGRETIGAADVARLSSAYDQWVADWHAVNGEDALALADGSVLPYWELVQLAELLAVCAREGYGVVCHHS